MKNASMSLLALAVLGCGGASPQDRKVMNEAVYQTDYATVWNAIVAEMVDRFHEDGIRLEDVNAGLVVSKWKAVASSVTSEEESESSAPINVSNRGAVRHSVTSIAGDMAQIRVKILQKGPPWRILVEAEGAHRSPNSPMLRPYAHGAADEPIWVQGKVDSMREAIYGRLKQYAIAGPPADAEAPIEKPAGEPEDPSADHTPPPPPPAAK